MNPPGSEHAQSGFGDNRGPSAHGKCSRFLPLREHELYALELDGILRHVLAARADGAAEQLRLATQMLAYRCRDRIETQVARKVPQNAVEDVVSIALARAMTMALKGSSMGEFLGLLRQVTRGAIADFTDANVTRQAHEESLPEHRATDGEDAPLDELRGEEDVDLTTPLFRETLIERMKKLSSTHRRVIYLWFLRGRDGAEIASAVPGMTVPNVHKIVSRFRADLRDDLGGG